jgi:RNA polymerase sigma-70 factor (ECF subfamily)
MNGYTREREEREAPTRAPGAADELAASESQRPGLPSPLDFDSVYTQHFDFACRSLQLLGVSPDAVEDAAQDVFSVVSRRLEEFAGISSIKTWIFAIVQRVAANQRRRRRRKQRPLEPFCESLEAGGPSPEANAEAAEAARLVQAFCESLDEDRRALLVLALLEGVPAREIAAAHGIPVFTVYSRIRAVREALRLFLTGHEVEK